MSDRFTALEEAWALPKGIIWEVRRYVLESQWEALAKALNKVVTDTAEFVGNEIIDRVEEVYGNGSR